MKTTIILTLITIGVGQTKQIVPPCNLCGSYPYIKRTLSAITINTVTGTAIVTGKKTGTDSLYFTQNDTTYLQQIKVR